MPPQNCTQVRSSFWALVAIDTRAITTAIMKAMSEKMAASASFLRKLIRTVQRMLVDSRMTRAYLSSLGVYWNRKRCDILTRSIADDIESGGNSKRDIFIMCCTRTRTFDWAYKHSSQWGRLHSQRSRPCRPTKHLKSTTLKHTQYAADVRPNTDHHRIVCPLTLWPSFRKNVKNENLMLHKVV